MNKLLGLLLLMPVLAFAEVPYKTGTVAIDENFARVSAQVKTLNNFIVGSSTSPTGVRGPAGTRGVTGAQGPAGVEGPTGPQGIQGIQGIQGVQGVPGETGSQGPPGNAYGNVFVLDGIDITISDTHTIDTYYEVIDNNVQDRTPYVVETFGGDTQPI